MACVAIAIGVGHFATGSAGLSEAGRRTLIILVLAAGLWLTEAIPAFAVSLLVIGLEIALLGRPDGAFAQTPNDWERFVLTWGSPLIWLFLGGFVMAAAAEKTGLTRLMAGTVLRYFGRRPSLVLLGMMVPTFVFSMFISNTATATMMMAVALPLLKSMPGNERFAKGVLLGVAFAANLGGMGTIIGSPPNAIAAGALEDTQPIGFALWMAVGLPPALLLAGGAWLFLALRYRSSERRIDTARIGRAGPSDDAPGWRRWVVVGVFALTVGLWLTGPWHGLPTTVVSFSPICGLTAAGVLDGKDIRGLPWTCFC